MFKHCVRSLLELTKPMTRRKGGKFCIRGAPPSELKRRQTKKKIDALRKCPLTHQESSQKPCCDDRKNKFTDPERMKLQ